MRADKAGAHRRRAGRRLPRSRSSRWRMGRRRRSRSPWPARSPAAVSARSGLSMAAPRAHAPLRPTAGACRRPGSWGRRRAWLLRWGRGRTALLGLLSLPRAGRARCGHCPARYAAGCWRNVRQTAIARSGQRRLAPRCSGQGAPARGESRSRYRSRCGSSRLQLRCCIRDPAAGCCVYALLGPLWKHFFASKETAVQFVAGLAVSATSRVVLSGCCRSL